MKYLVVVFSVLFLSCNSNKSEEKKGSCEKPKEEFQMYEASEMATLMEQMYVHNNFQPTHTIVKLWKNH